MDENSYDLIIVGGGVAATHTLLALLDETQGHSLRIAIIEKSTDLWRGVPYGERSSINSLTITDLDEFLPPVEREAFYDWLSINWERLARRIRDEGGAIGGAWLERHVQDIGVRAWGQLYIPRRFYGDFLSDKTRRKLEQSSAVIETLQGTVQTIIRSGDLFTLRVAQSDGQKNLTCDRILLAVGSPPVGRIGDRHHEAAPLIEDLYESSLQENLVTITRALERMPEGRRHLFVLGSNATSLELAYMINWSPALRRVLEHIVVLSSGGRWPARIHPSDNVGSTQALDALDGRLALKASEIFEASSRDIARLVASSSHQGCDFSAVAERLAQILGEADEAEARRFHHFFGMRFTRLIRRAGADYRDAAQALIDDGKMEVRAGWLESLSCEAEGLVPQATGPDGAKLELGAPFAAVVNCSGFEGLSQTSHSLLSGMLDSGLVRINAAQRGIEVDEDFRAAKNIFVTGPLLAGVFHSKARYWHVENVRRIAELAPQVAKSIARDMGL